MKIITDLFSSSSPKDKVGICLSGGGALGFAHIGVLQALGEHGIYPTQIVGSSMGAIIGTLYAAGFTPAEMLQMIKDQKLYKTTKLMTFRPSFLKSGLSTHVILRALIKELIPHNSFEGLEKKLQVCVVNLNTAQSEIISAGRELDKWVAASASIPGLFEAIEFDGDYYVDGGLLNNMPAQSLKNRCKILIGVDVIPHSIPQSLTKPIDTLVYSVRAMEHQNSRKGRLACNFLIEPRAIDEFHEFSFEAYLAIYQSGYDAAIQYINNHAAILMLGEK